MIHVATAAQHSFALQNVLETPQSLREGEALLSRGRSLPPYLELLAKYIWNLYAFIRYGSVSIDPQLWETIPMSESMDVIDGPSRKNRPKRRRVSDLPATSVVLARAGDEAAQRSLADRLLFCAIGLAAGLNGSAAADRSPTGSSPYTPEGLSELLIEGLRQYNPRAGRLDNTLREHLKLTLTRNRAKIPKGFVRIWDERDRYLPAPDALIHDMPSWRAAMRCRHENIHARLIAAIRSQFQETHTEFPEDLFREALAGSADALNTLSFQMANQLIRFRLSVERELGSDAEDIIQHVILKVKDALPNVRNPAKFAGYLKKAANNAYCDWLERIRRRKEVPFDIPATADHDEWSGDERFKSPVLNPAEELMAAEEEADSESAWREMQEALSGFRSFLQTAYQQTVRRLAASDRKDPRKQQRAVVFEAWLRENLNQAEIARRIEIDQATGMRRLDEGIAMFRRVLLDAGVLKVLADLDARRALFRKGRGGFGDKTSEYGCLHLWLEQDATPEALAGTAGASSTRAFKNTIRKQLRIWLGWDNMEGEL